MKEWLSDLESHTPLVMPVRTSADVLGVEHGNGEREGTGVTPWRTYYCVAIAAGALAVLAHFVATNHAHRALR
jgi:hypothetical protein